MKCVIKIGNTISRKHGQKVVIYGTEGIGKTSLASQFPDPLFIDTEGSTKNYTVNRIEEGRSPSSWTELKNWVGYVKQNPTVCKTLVIDTIDWAERLCNEHVCAEHNKDGIEDFGYGQGYTYASEELGKFLNLLSDVTELGIHVVLTAHAQIRSLTLPDEIGTYDHYELKLGQKTSSRTASIVKEWADMVLFINYKTFIVTDDKSKKGKAQGDQRVMYTTHRPSWDAKNRHGLQDELPLSFEPIAHIFNDVQSGPENEVQTQEQTHVDQPIEQQLEEVQPVQGDMNNQENTQFVEADYSGLPQNLVDLMKASGVTKEEIQQACGPAGLGGKGYFPQGMKVEDYPPEFIDSVLVAAWQQVFQLIEENRKLPF